VIAVDAVADRLRWESAYRSAYPSVYRGLMALGARADEAEDALHDAFLAGLQRGSGRPIVSLDGWIFVVATRAWRRRRIRDAFLQPWTLLRESPTPEGDASPDVLIAVQKLPLRQRQIVVARYVIGLSQDETASLLGIARGTVSAATTSALASLRRALEGER
jgi:RNA polymerase sigma factor (sigma-70 family)